jgi:hypothetical protein
VSAFRVVEALDVVERREPGLVAGLEGLAVDELGLERREEALSVRVVEGVAAAADARQDAGSRRVLPKARPVYWANSIGRRNARSRGVAMGEKRRAADRAGRPAMRSPGRPPVGRLEHRQRFKAAIARGLLSEDAAVQARVSAAVGVRWFREDGGMPSVTLASGVGAVPVVCLAGGDRSSARPRRRG